jgi:hypothetical protein
MTEPSTSSAIVVLLLIGSVEETTSLAPRWSGPPRLADEAEDPVATTKPGDRRADVFDRAGDVAAEDHRKQVLMYCRANPLITCAS